MEGRCATTESGRELSDEYSADEQLAKQAARGCELAFERLVERHERRLLQFLIWRVGDRDLAQDCVQETLLAAYRGLGGFDPSWRFSTWIFSIARRVAARMLREGQRLAKDKVEFWALYEMQDNCARRGGSDQRLSMESALRCRSPSPADVVLMAESRESFWQCIECAVNRHEYQALWISYVDECTVTEAARRLDRSCSGLKSLLSRARRKIRTRIVKHFNPRQGLDSVESFVCRFK